MDANAKIKLFIESELISNEELQALTETDELLATGIIDSVGIIKLLQFISDKFSVQIDDREIIPENFNTIKSLTALIQQKQPK